MNVYSKSCYLLGHRFPFFHNSHQIQYVLVFSSESLLPSCQIVVDDFSLFPCSNISEMRKSYKDAFLKKHNIKLGFMSAFVKAAAYALADQPAVNAGIDLIFWRETWLCGLSLTVPLHVWFQVTASMSAEENDLGFTIFSAKPQNQRRLIYCLWTTLTHLHRPHWSRGGTTCCL